MPMMTDRELELSQQRRALIARELDGDPAAAAELEAVLFEIHAERYPAGCGPYPGHHCGRCHDRLGDLDLPHPVRIFRVGAMHNYRGQLSGACTIGGCKWAP